MTWLSEFWLWGLPPVWVAIWLAHRYRQQNTSWQQWLEPHLLQAMLATPTTSRVVSSWPWLIGFTLSMLIISLAGPSWQQREQPLLASTAARVLVIDMSYSMLATDVNPSRIAWARQFLKEKLNDDFEGETALIAFSGQAFIVSPLTRDNNTLRRFINALQPNRMPSDGSRLDLALREANELLSASPSGRGRIIIVSDGINAQAATREVASLTYQAGSELIFVAVGTAEGSPLPAGSGGLLRDDNDQIVIASASIEDLRQLAETAGGQFFTYSESTESLTDLNLGLHQATTPSTDSESLASVPENGGFWLLWLILPCLLLLFRKNALPVMLVGALLFNSAEVSASGWSKWWQNDNKSAWQALNSGRPDIALQLADDPLLQAHALYQLGDYRALLQLPDLIETAEGLYLRGNAMAQLGLLRQSMDSFQQAVALRNDFPSARYNLALVRFYLEQQSINAAANDPEADSLTSDADNTAQSDARDAQSALGTESDLGQENQGSLGAGIANELGDRPDSEIDAAVIDAELQQIIADLQRESGLSEQDLLSSWRQTLNTDLGELFQRKFLRDYQRATGDR